MRKYFNIFFNNFILYCAKFYCLFFIRFNRLVNSFFPSNPFILRYSYFFSIIFRIILNFNLWRLFNRLLVFISILPPIQLFFSETLNVWYMFIASEHFLTIDTNQFSWLSALVLNMFFYLRFL